MTHHPRTPPDVRPRRHVRELTVGLLAILLLGIGALVVLDGNLMSTGGTAAAPPAAPALAAVQVPVGEPPRPGAAEPVDPPVDPPVGELDHVDGLDGLDGLDPELVERVLLAREAAAADGVVIEVTSGLRSEAEQRRLFDDAVELHGTPELAARYVLPPEESAHVQGRAIDVGPAGAQAWLAERGAKFGLCRVYENEPWHFEPTVAPGEECPAMVPDASSG